MAQTLTQNWWLVALRGVVAIFFGVAAFVWPSLTLEVLVFLFGAYALLDGIFALIAGITGSAASGGVRWLLAVGGIAGIIVGVLTFTYPNVTATTLVYLIGVWAIFVGIFGIAAAIELRRVISDEWLYILSGVLSIVFGVLVFIYPQAGALSIIWLIAVYALIYGVTLVAFGLRMRSLGESLSSLTSTSTQSTGQSRS
jgi:uncharacterized membrane protein HdeD (DUF308 family)